MSQRVKNGNKAEIIFLKWAVCNEYVISIPFTHAVPYDCVFEDAEGVLYKVQIKKAYNTIQRGKNVVFCELRRVGNTGEKAVYHKGDFDFIVAVHVETEDIWMIPFDAIKNKNCGIQLSSIKWAGYKKKQIPAPCVVNNSLIALIGRAPVS